MNELSPESQQAIKEAAAAVSPGPSIPIYLSGPMPRGTWCGTCVMVFMGTISAEKEFQTYARDLTEKAIDAGASFVSIDFPERDDLQLQPAITVGPSWLLDQYFTELDLPTPAPMLPVCWTHLTGMPPKHLRQQQERTHHPRQSIIPGKAYGTDQYRD